MNARVAFSCQGRSRPALGEAVGVHAQHQLASRKRASPGRPPAHLAFLHPPWRSARCWRRTYPCPERVPVCPRRCCHPHRHRPARARARRPPMNPSPRLGSLRLAGTLDLVRHATPTTYPSHAVVCQEALHLRDCALGGLGLCVPEHRVATLTRRAARRGWPSRPLSITCAARRRQSAPQCGVVHTQRLALGTATMRALERSERDTSSTEVVGRAAAALAAGAAPLSPLLWPWLSVGLPPLALSSAA